MCRGTAFAAGFAFAALVLLTAPANAATCQATCDFGIQITCCVEEQNQCSATGSSVSCYGQTLSCGDVNGYFSCENNCFAVYDACISGCDGIPVICNGCERRLDRCLNNCGGFPTTSIGC